MLHPRYSILNKSTACKSCLLQYSVRPPLLPEFVNSISFRALSGNASKYRSKKNEPKNKKKRAKQEFQKHNKNDLIQYSLCDAMRYIRAFEAGQKPTSAKYDLAVRFITTRGGTVIRNQIRFPHPPRTDLRICVICKPGSKIASSARASGATLVGENNVFEAVREGQIDFDRCICHPDSMEALSKSGVARILGPKQLMPSARTGTVVKNVGAALKEMVGSSVYRERSGVVRVAVGQLGYGPEELQRNIQAIMGKLQGDAASARSKGKTKKELYEVVLSSTRSPGFSLDGTLSGPQSVQVADLST